MRRRNAYRISTMSNLHSAADLFLASTIREFRAQKSMAERAINQLSFEQLRVPLDENTNSIAVIMKHMAGNLLSRWRDFLTSDGEKPDRDRDGEFVDTFTSRDELMAFWERGWACALGSLESLTSDHLTKTVAIRSQPHSVVDAIQRSLAHTGYHVGQIVQLARYLAKDQWTTLTIPRGQSKRFNAQMQARHAKP
jgi:hypothetical protein